MGGLYSRLKTWVSTEDVTYSDLNAEFDNVLNNFVPLMLDDYSTNVAQMQTKTDPGEVGSESLATTLAGEIARLRQMISEITGETHWYTSPSTSLTGLANAIGSGLTDNRLASGRVRVGSQQPMFLVPHGAAKTVTLKGSTTNFLYFIDGTQYTISTDVTLTNLTAAPSTNNTALINDTVAADQDWTKYTGENGTEITIDTVGAEITSLVGKIAAFKLDNGSASEYFIAEVQTNKLVKARRGYFFNSSDAPIPRVVYSNNDTITLMKLAWIFATTAGALTATYNNPIWSADEPSSPSIGDYWFDLDNNTWKRYDVSSYVDADAMLVGVCIQDTTNTVAGRSFEFFANYADTNSVEVTYSTAAQVKSNWPQSQINVWGSVIKNEQNYFTWDMATNLDSGVTEGASTYYFFYITENGDVIISDIRPYDRREDLQGHYHPHQSWRCVGWAYNNSSSDLTAVESFFTRYRSELILPSQTAASNIEVIEQVIPLDSSGGAFTKTLPPAAYWRGQSMTFIKTSSDFNAITLDGFASETINGSTTTSLNTQHETVTLISDGTNIYVKNRYIPSILVADNDFLTPSAGFGTVSGQYVFRRREGDSLYCTGYWKSGTTTATNATFDIGESLTIDSAKMTNVATIQTVGFWTLISAGATITTNTSNGGHGSIVYDGSDTNTLAFSYQSNGDDLLIQATNGLFATGQSASFWFRVPISGWTG